MEQKLMNGYEKWVNARNYLWLSWDLWPQGQRGFKWQGPGLWFFMTLCHLTHTSGRWLGVEWKVCSSHLVQLGFQAHGLLKTSLSYDYCKTTGLGMLKKISDPLRLAEPLSVVLIPLVIFSVNNRWSSVPTHFIHFAHQISNKWFTHQKSRVQNT